jgi:AGZA family xanthine/uracil permease-like MFS transporter
MTEIFHTRQYGTDIRTELTAGFTTFLTMMYIIPVNGFILADAGLPMDAVITATALITILATMINGFWSNTPIAMSVGMGLNAYFSYTLVLGMKIPWQTALGIVFISGVVFILLSFSRFRIWIMRSIPMDLRRAISAGIGAFIAFVGLKQLGILIPDKTTIITLGRLGDPATLLGIFGFFITLILYVRGIRGAFILGISVTSVAGWILGIGNMPESFFSLPASISPIAFKLDISSVFSLSLLPAVTTLVITDMFDSLGTLTAVGARMGIFQEGGDDDETLEKTLEADAVATAAGALLGVSTTTSFIESSSGVEAGGRTGLTAVFTALLPSPCTQTESILQGICFPE